MRASLICISLLISYPSFSQYSEFEAVDFSKADSIAEIYIGYDLRDQKKLAEFLTKDLSTDVEKFRAIFKWITLNISYDLDLLSESNRNESQLKFRKNKLDRWRKHFNKKILKTLVQHKSSICSGYSMLLQSLCAQANLQCEIIEGYGRTTETPIGSGRIDHAWNAVRLNDNWFLCDPTWASGYVTKNKDRFIPSFNKYYFLTPPELFSANHFPVNNFWLLTHDKPLLKDFLNAPVKSSGFIANKLNHYFPLEGRFSVKRDSSVRFSFTSNLPPEKVETVSVYLSKKVNKEFVDQEKESRELGMDKEGNYFIFYRFKEVGVFRIHIYLNRRLIFMYEVTVR
ncbi:MAG: hypothetical protein JSS79_00065 [Bacteroidetes bacterium]|nr:hypothetical protein [Bacteroidota bacterium]